MSSNDSVATATENASRLGYKHVCVNYLHVASHDYQKLIQHTHTHTHTHKLQALVYDILPSTTAVFSQLRHRVQKTVS